MAITHDFTIQEYDAPQQQSVDYYLGVPYRSSDGAVFAITTDSSRALDAPRTATTHTASGQTDTDGSTTKPRTATTHTTPMQTDVSRGITRDRTDSGYTNPMEGEAFAALTKGHDFQMETYEAPSPLATDFEMGYTYRVSTAIAAATDTDVGRVIDLIRHPDTYITTTLTDSGRAITRIRVGTSFMQAAQTEADQTLQRLRTATTGVEPIRGRAQGRGGTNHYFEVEEYDAPFKDRVDFQVGDLSYRTSSGILEDIFTDADYDWIIATSAADKPVVAGDPRLELSISRFVSQATIVVTDASGHVATLDASATAPADSPVAASLPAFSGQSGTGSGVARVPVAGAEAPVPSRELLANRSALGTAAGLGHAEFDVDLPSAMGSAAGTGIGMPGQKRAYYIGNAEVPAILNIDAERSAETREVSLLGSEENLLARGDDGVEALTIDFALFRRFNSRYMSLGKKRDRLEALVDQPFYDNEFTYSRWDGFLSVENVSFDDDASQPGLQFGTIEATYLPREEYER